MKGARSVPLLAAGAVALVLGGCSSPPMLDPSDVEQQIVAGLEQEVGGTFAATCPTEIPAEDGFAFTCSVRDETQGMTITVTVTQDDAEGAFSWRVSSVSPG
jgi:hypothetical protein